MTQKKDGINQQTIKINKGQTTISVRMSELESSNSKRMHSEMETSELILQYEVISIQEYPHVGG